MLLEVYCADPTVLLGKEERVESIQSLSRTDGERRGLLPGPRQKDKPVPSERSRDKAGIPSLYNFQVRVEGGALLYNTNSGALIHLNGEDGRLLGHLLTSGPWPRRQPRIPGDVYASLLEGGFLVHRDCDEVADVRKRFWQARGSTPIVLTITTTQDCNLGCFYCYEERSPDQLCAGDVDTVVASAKERLTTSGKRSLHVDWYGGEPLLNVEFLEAASEALQSLCRDLAVSYHASVISNGTRWPTDVNNFVKRHAIRQVQITFDGLRDQHNRSRRYRPGYGTGSNSSFDEAVALVDGLLDAAQVDIRLNIGSHNVKDVWPFLDMARERGWFGKRFPAVIQPARLSAFTDECGFLRPREIPQDEFNRLRSEIRRVIAGAAAVEESEAPDGLPLPKASVCAALAQDSVVIGADGLEYRCGLQVGQQAQAIGRIESKSSPFQILQTEVFPDKTWWDAFDPTTLPSCSRCSFLPICFGGCAFKHLRKDLHAIGEQGAYWRKNLPRLIAARAGTAADIDTEFSEADQFRRGRDVV